MKLSIEFDNPLQPTEKIVKTITIRSNKNIKYIEKLIKTAENGMVMVPLNIKCESGKIDNMILSIVSTPAVKGQVYQKPINQKPKEIIPVEIKEYVPKPKLAERFVRWLCE